MWNGRLALGAPGANKVGLTLVEVCIAMAVVATVLLAAGAAFSSSMVATGQATRMADGALFLESTVESVSGQPYDNLLALNGNQVFDGATLAASNYSVDLTVFQAQLDLIQIRAVLTDLDLSRELGRVTTLRSRR